MKLWVVIGTYVAFWVVIMAIASQHSRAQVPPTIVQELNGYPPAFVLYWQVGTPPPACNVTQANGSPGPPLYSLAIRQGPPDTVMVCLNGTGGNPVWVPMVTAP
jgi:hypothetical protein